LDNYTGLTAKAIVYNLDGSIYEPLSLEKTVSVSSKEAKECFVLSAGNNSALSDLNFIRLELRDNQNNLVSDNFYWRNKKNADDYTALNTLPQADLSTHYTEKRENGKYIIHYTLTNNSSTVAFGIRLRVINERTGKRILPIFMQENYFTLLPGETKNIPVEFDESLIDNDNARVLIKQYGQEETPTSIEEVASNKKKRIVKVFPNPVTDLLHLDSENEFNTVKIRNINGKIIYSGKNESTINVSHLEKGFYLLQVQADEITCSTKLIKN
jgi:hypothetical protein